MLEVFEIEQCSVVPAVFINMGVILNFMKLLLKVLWGILNLNEVNVKPTTPSFDQIEIYTLN